MVPTEKMEIRLKNLEKSWNFAKITKNHVKMV